MKKGCTCGQCIAGVLSPKMAFRLTKCASSSFELLHDTLPTFPGKHGDGPLHDPEVFLFDYVPPELRMEVTRPFAVGFANCMSSAAYLLKQGQLPKPRMVGQCATIVPGLDKSASKTYLERGGMPEYALDAVLARSQQEHEECGGDGSFAEEDDNAARLAALPACANDDKYELVRQRLFENSDFWPCGPYGFDDQAADEDDYVYYDTSGYQR